MSDLDLDAQWDECECGHARAEHHSMYPGSCYYTESRSFKGRSVRAQCPCRRFMKAASTVSALLGTP